MRICPSSLCLLVVFSAPYASAAPGENLLANPGFTSDLSGWILFVGEADWDPLDADNSPSSGSAFLTHHDTSSQTQVLLQCLPVAEDRDFNLSGRTYIPSGQAVAGFGFVRVLWFRDEGCVDFIDSGLTNSSSALDEWRTLRSIVLQSPTDTESARVSLVLGGPFGPGNDFSAHFDNVVFYEGLFADGFESGDTSFWTDTVP